MLEIFIPRFKMEKNAAISALLTVGEHDLLPALSVDCVILTFHENQLKVLLIKHRHRDMWALPGGFVGKEEPIDAAAYRVLKDRTGLDDVFPQQFHVFGDPRRSEKRFHLEDLEKDGVAVRDDLWILQRFVSIGYYALVRFSRIGPARNTLSEECAWWDIHEVPGLILDHREILDSALAALRMHINYHPIGYDLMPANFTMPELQKLYEAILDKKLDRRNFQRKILGLGILHRLKEPRKGLPHKSPFLYSFDLRKYNRALKEGFIGGW
jgi:ADP-ribose pyrophosphatase YjhB (NUDIX family)